MSKTVLPGKLNHPPSGNPDRILQAAKINSAVLSHRDKNMRQAKNGF